MNVTIDYAGQTLTVDLTFEPAEGDGFHEPRHEAGWLVEDVRDEAGRLVELDSEELLAEIERRGMLEP